MKRLLREERQEGVAVARFGGFLDVGQNNTFYNL